MSTHVRLSDLGELLAVIPYRLGFHPDESIVVVEMTDGVVGIVQRVDLPAGGGGLRPRELAVLARSWTGGQVMLIGYETLPGASSVGVKDCVNACARHGVDVLDVVVVREGRWFVADMTGAALTVERPLPAPADVAAVAEFVGHGVAPLPSRSALEAGLLAVTDEAVHVGIALSRRRRVCGEAERRRREGLAAWARLLRCDTTAGCGVCVGGERGGARLGADLAAAALHVLDDTPVRDALATRLAPGLVPDAAVEPDALAAVDDAFASMVLDCSSPARAGALHVVAAGEVGVVPLSAPASARASARAARGVDVRARLAMLVASTPSHERAVVLTLYGLHCWWVGDGAVAEIATRGALRLDPRLTLAELVSGIVRSGMRPPRP